MPVDRRRSGSFHSRVIRSRFVQHFCSTPATVFPLLLPVREALADAPHECDVRCATPGPGDDSCVLASRLREAQRDEVWIVLRYDPPRSIAILRVGQRRIVRQSIVLEATAENETMATNDLLLRGRTRPGNEALSSIALAFALEMGLDEVLVNRYLETGQRMAAGEALIEAAIRVAGQPRGARRATSAEEWGSPPTPSWWRSADTAGSNTRRFSVGAERAALRPENDRTDDP